MASKRRKESLKTGEQGQNLIGQRSVAVADPAERSELAVAEVEPLWIWELED